MVKNEIKDIVNYCCGGYDCAKTFFATLSEDERIELKATLKQKCVHSTKWLDIGIATIMFALAFVSSITVFNIVYFFSWSEFKILLVLYFLMIVAHMYCKFKEGTYVKILTHLKEYEKSFAKC